MLVHNDAVATVPVKNLAAASKFYEDKLGLEPLGPEEPGMRIYKSGRSKLFVYESQYAGTNAATAVTWGVGDEFEQIVRGLKDKGVRFEHYDLPNTRHEGDVHVMGPMRTAWFKDPDGNIHNIVNQ